MDDRPRIESPTFTRWHGRRMGRSTVNFDSLRHVDAARASLDVPLMRALPVRQPVY